MNSGNELPPLELPQSVEAAIEALPVSDYTRLRIGEAIAGKFHPADWPVYPYARNVQIAVCDENGELIELLFRLGGQVYDKRLLVNQVSIDGVDF